MFSKGRKKGSVKFSVKPNDGIATAAVAGDFNKWQPTSMKKGKDGKFAVEVSLDNGTYEYKFIIDGQWVVDPDNNAWALNPYGTLNSVLHVE